MADSKIENAQICDKIASINDIDHLPKPLSHPEQLRTIQLRSLWVIGNTLILIEELVKLFANKLETLSLSVDHHCKDNSNLWFDGYRFANLCSELPELRLVSFAAKVYLTNKPSTDEVSRFKKSFCAPFWLYGPLGCVKVCVGRHSQFNHIQIYSQPCIIPDEMRIGSSDLADIQFNIDTDEKVALSDLSIAFQPLWSSMTRIVPLFTEKQEISLAFLHALEHAGRRSGTAFTLMKERKILPNHVEKYIQLRHFQYLELFEVPDINETYDYQCLISWFRLLPNISKLFVDLSELKHWLIRDPDNVQLDFFLQGIDRLYLECSSIIDLKANEDIMESLLLFLMDKYRFPQLKCLRFIGLKNISSAWCNIDQWIAFILKHVTEHQLTCVRFDVKDKQHEMTNMQIRDELITINKSSYIIDVHHFVCQGLVSLWIERKREC